VEKYKGWLFLVDKAVARRLYQPKTATAQRMWTPPCPVRRSWRPTADLNTVGNWRAGAIRNHNGLQDDLGSDLPILPDLELIDDYQKRL
jgi:hypothetical protein